MPGEIEGNPETPPQGTPPQKPPETPKTFTQAELDLIVQERLARDRKQFADYDDLKAQAAKFKESEDAKKDELTKATEAAAAAKREAQEAVAGANATLKRAGIMTEAAKQNAVDPEIVVALLANDGGVTIDAQGIITGAAEAVTKLLTEKPFLARGKPGASGGQFGGFDQPTMASKIAEAEAKGDFKTALELKVIAQQAQQTG